MHRVAPLLKWLALIIAFIAPFRGWLFFFIAVGLFIISIALNQVKWRFNFSYEYILFGNNLKIIKTYNVLKFKEVVRIDLNTVSDYQLITPEDIPQKGALVAFDRAKPLELILKIIVKKEKEIIITVDKYLFSKIEETIEEMENKK